MTLYRTFPKAEYADAFMSGKIFLSTLDRCREMEGDVRQDRGEGTITYFPGFVSGSDNTAALRMATQRVGIHVDERALSGVTIEKITSKNRLPDAYVLCLSRVIVPKFGQHVVRVDHPRFLFRALSKALGAFNEALGAYSGKPAGEQGWMQSIQYRNRVYGGTGRGPPHIGFIKPATPFAEEREVRMLWSWISGKPVRPDGLLEIECPEAARYCARIPSPPSQATPPAVLAGTETASTPAAPAP
jgi:hypothetical protein